MVYVRLAAAVAAALLVLGVAACGGAEEAPGACRYAESREVRIPGSCRYAYAKSHAGGFEVGHRRGPRGTEDRGL